MCHVQILLGMSIGSEINELIEQKFGPAKRGHAADELGISRPYISDIISGKRNLSAEMAVRLSEMFGNHVGRDLLIKQATLEYETARLARKTSAQRARK